MKILIAVALLCATSLPGRAQDLNAAGRDIFEHRCALCHGADANGGEFGPAIAERIESFPDARIIETVTHGLPTRGMPPIDIEPAQLPALVAYLRTLRPRIAGFKPYPAHLALVGGTTLDGTVLAEGVHDVQLRGAQGGLHLLRRDADNQFREVTSQSDWSSYNGSLGGNRYTPLSQISRANVKTLAPRWVFNMPNASRLEATPVVSRGILYVTNGNECYALDAGSGRPIWHYQRPRTVGLIGNAAGGINRGVALTDTGVIMVTDDAHLIALDRTDGSLQWDTVLADWHHNYNATSAPLVVGQSIITGSAGGEEGVRGFVAAFDFAGKERWRFWTVPARGEPAARTWGGGRGIEHGGGTAWFTGVYDSETDTLFWPTGNPGNDYNGDDRPGDDLYADSILALDPKDGRLKWHYQTTPHDVWDWDASETPLVIDALWNGRQRRLLAQGNRNGFFYVLDRDTGKLLSGTPFVHELTWASGIGRNGRPIKLPNQEPTASGTRVCPSQGGATNWYSPSYNPATGLFYLQTNERCSIFTKRANVFEYGRPFLGGTQRNDTDVKPQRLLRALELNSGAIRWETPQIGSATSFGGTLATPELVFFGDDSGAFAAADAATGQTLWSFELGNNWRASPMAYQFDGQELIGVAAAGSIIVFGLVP